MCAFWPGKADRDLALVDAIWQWLQDHTCVDRDKAGLHLTKCSRTKAPLASRMDHLVLLPDWIGLRRWLQLGRHFCLEYGLPEEPVLPCLCTH